MDTDRIAAAAARAARPFAETEPRARAAALVAVADALDGLTRAAESNNGNVFGAVVDGARAGLTNEEICTRLRRDLGFGQPLVVV